MSSAVSSNNPYKYPHLPSYKYGDELIQTAKRIVSPGRGILAADESTGTIGSRLAEIKLENNKQNRREYRKLLFTTKEINKFISGVILYEETLFDKLEDGKDLVQPLRDQGIILGIKVDLGTKHLPGTDDETYTQGLTDLDKRCQQYYKAGCRFAKWRAVLRISAGTPSNLAIEENARGLAMYAAVCQSNGLVPIVEPEILMDGEHTLSVCQYWTEQVITTCYFELMKHHVLLEGTLLKPNMVVPGKQCKDKADAKSIAKATVTALQRSVPPAVPGIVFLSGGQSEEEATLYLNAMNSMDLGPKPWRLSFSYGRALQKTCIKTWAGKKENFAAAQQAFAARARANSLATEGKYTGDAASKSATESSYVKNYKY